MEKEFNELGTIFQQIITDIKSSFPVWEDFTNKAVKLHSALRCTVSATTIFLDAFQKLVDASVGSRGANGDIGSLLTKLCLRQRTIESRLKNCTASIAECLITPLQAHADEWKKGVVQLEKDRLKEHKKVHAEMKKASHETCRLQKKVNKGKLEYRGQLDEATKEFNLRFAALEATEKNSVTLALVEERSHLCTLISCLKPVMEHELAMISEAEHLKEIMENLSKYDAKPSCISEEIRENANKCLPSNSTIDRKKRALKDDIDSDSMSNSSSSNHSSLDALNLCASVASSESSIAPHHRPALPTSVSVDRAQTISYRHQQMKPRANLTYETYARPSIVGAAPKTENPYAVPSTLPSSMPINSVKVVDKIYSRPALILNKENGSTLKRVMTPTVPSLEVLNLRTDGNGKADMKTVESSGGNLNKSDISDEIMSLADALRELQESTAQLQLPYGSKGAPSCQSLQCSSGYGTMTNVSSSSVETISSGPSVLDALARNLMESCNFPDLDKYSTLPNKRQLQSSLPQDLKRPASAAGLESGSNTLTTDETRTPDIPLAYSADHIYAFSDSRGTSESLQDHQNSLYYSIGTQNPSHLTASIEEDDMDDLPLPPPPEELEFAAPSVILRKSVKPNPLSAHADVMQSLNKKLSVIQSAGVNSDRPFRDIQRSLSMAQQTDAATCNYGDIQKTHFDQENAREHEEVSETDSFEHMIRRGVRLRHTICNDRSAPRVLKH